MKQDIRWWTTGIKVPKVGQVVLIQHEYGCRTLSVAEWTGETFVNLSDRWFQESYECEDIPTVFSEVSTVTAWMPIPDPPHGFPDNDDDE